MHVRIERHGPVTVLELDRPDRRNAIGPQVADDLETAARSLGADGGVSVIVLAGAGPSFCAGADMQERLAGADQSAAVFAAVRQASSAVHGLPVPVIAALHGHAIGAGLELAAMCDYRIAEDGTALGLPEVRQGITSGGGLLALASLLPRGRLAALAYSGAVVPPAEALTLGVIDELVGEGEARGRALELAAAFAAHPREALMATKTALRSVTEPLAPQQWEFVGALQRTLEGGPAQRQALDRLRQSRAERPHKD